MHLFAHLAVDLLKVAGETSRLPSEEVMVLSGVVSLARQGRVADAVEVRYSLAERGGATR